MQHLQTGLKLAPLLALSLLLVPADATGQWSNSRGGPERDGARTGSAELPIPQVKWRQALGGDLGISAIWQIPDPVVPRIALTVGGRVSLKRWDDSLSWQGQLFGLSKFIASSDIDDDGVTDLLFASGGSVESTVVGYTPDGDAAFTAPPGILGPITSGTRIVDLDQDGFRDLYITSYRAGPTGAIAAAFRFPNGDASAGELMYTLDGAERNGYVGGFYDVIAEFDGTPGLEILALGHRNIHLYDAATGALESTTRISGLVPYARASLRLVDIDSDGVSEVFAFSNQAWSQANNRRHVTLYGYRDGDMTELWERDLGNDPGARLEFTDSSVVNLDGTGPLEVVFSVRDADGDWTTEIRDAASGSLLDSIAGERLEDIAITSRDTVLFTHDDGRPLRSYRFSRTNGLSALALHPDVKLVRCRQDRPTNAEVLRRVPCSLPVSGEPRRGVLAGEYDPITNQFTALVSLDMGGSLSEVARFDARGGVISGVLEILPGHAAVIAVAHSDGQLLPLDERLQFLQPSPKPPFSWAGIRYGSRFAAFDLPGFPLIVPNANGERIAALSGAGRATVLDATGDPSVVAGVETVWSEGSGSRIVVGGASDDPTVVLLNRTADIAAFSAIDGTQRWLASDAFTKDRPLHSDPLIVTDETQTPLKSHLWFHRRNSAGTYDLTALDLADGSTVVNVPDLDTNDSGWKRLALATWDGTPAPISGRLGELWRFDLDGNVADVQSSSSATFVLPVPRVDENPLIIVDGLNELSVFDPTTSTTLWSMPRVNSLGPRRGAILNVAGRPHFATADSSSPIFRSVDVESGVIDFDYNLVGGELRDPQDPLPSPTPLLGNVTAITDLTGAGDPAFLVGSTDGFIYAIHALTGDLIWALFVGAQVGEILPADWDGDGQLELVASAGDGTLLGIGRFSGDGPAWVNDTNGSSVDDIDELQTEDTLFAAWAPVDGATSYEVAVFTNDNQPITAGFADAGNQTEMAIRGLPLEAGVRYRVSVRAVSSAGISPDRPSDGVTVIPAGDESQGGCCQVGGSPTEGGLQALLLGALCFLVTRRRRRKS